MAPQRVTLRAHVAGALADATRSQPGLRIEAYPMGRRLLLTCHGPYPGDEAFAGFLGVPTDKLHTVSANGTRSLILASPGHVEDLLRVADDADAVLVPPLVWSEGEVRLTALCVGPEATSRLSEALGGARIESKRGAHRTSRRPVEESLLGALTKRQAQALTAAIGGGYYETPRRVTTADVAGSLQISRSTFEEHLRAAESHVVKALAPLVQLHGRAEGVTHAEALAVYARFSRELGLYVHLTLREGRVAAVKLTEREPPQDAGTDHPYLARILEHLASGNDDLQDIPVDLDVAPFERRVLEALRKIPPGEVLTYGQLAQRLGSARAARAVGNALAKNPIPLIIPCHRVVPSSGGVGNYSGGGGSETKKKLLEREGARPPE